MKSDWSRPDIVNFTFVVIAVFLFSLIFFFGIFSIGYGQECTTEACPPRSNPLQQVSRKSAIIVGGKVHPAVVRMEHDDAKGRSYFTGVLIVAPNKLRMDIIVTAAHVFDGPGETRAYLSDGRVLSGEILGLDRLWDIAIVRVEGSNLTAMKLATEAPMRGDVITAYGFGWVGKQYTRTQGIALGYTLFNGQNTANTLLCSFVVRNGDSGGPMVNDRCEVAAIISCSDDQSGTNGTWAARIKVIMDRAIARKIKQVNFATKEDTGRLSLPPIARRVAPPVVEAGTARYDEVEAGIENARILSKVLNNAKQGTKATAPSAGLGLPVGVTFDSMASDALAWAIPTIATLLGVGLTGGAGWGGWVVLKTLLALYRRRKGKSVDQSADSFSAIARDDTEAIQLLQLSQLEGRNPVHDAIVGRFAYDTIDQFLAMGPDGPAADKLRELRVKLESRFNETAPLTVKE